VLPVINKPQSLKNIAYNIIKDAILTLKFKPGQALSNRDLAAQLQISETPIRDALQDLEQEGFVIRAPRKGTFVTEIDPQDIEQTFQIRASLEELAVRLATPRLDKTAFQEGERLLQDAEAALAQGDRERCSELGAQFHQLFIQRTRTRRLTVILGNLDDHLTRFRHISDLIIGRLEKSQGEHRQVFEAAHKGDVEGAAKAMYAHLQSVVKDVRETEPADRSM
jgi:DNA-binding GntR family transcriptional regulator